MAHNPHPGPPAHPNRRLCRQGTDAVWCRWQHHNSSHARRQLVRQHLPHVRKVAGAVLRRMPAHTEYDELVADGTIGLLGAMDRFDPDRGIPFAAYATTRIRGAMIDGMRRMDFVPRSVRRNLRQLHQADMQLHTTLQRQPTDTELADKLGITLTQLETIRADRQAAASPLQLDRPTHPDADTTLMDLLHDNDTNPAALIDQQAELELLQAALNALPTRSRDVLLKYHAQERELTEIGSNYQLTPSRICQIKKQAERQVRSHMQTAGG